MNYRGKKHEAYDSSDDSNGEDLSFEEEDKFKQPKLMENISNRVNFIELKDKFNRFNNLTRINEEDKTKK
jgi:hypothetical protein